MRRRKCVQDGDNLTSADDVEKRFHDSIVEGELDGNKRSVEFPRARDYTKSLLTKSLLLREYHQQDFFLNEEFRRNRNAKVAFITMCIHVCNDHYLLSDNNPSS